MRLFLAATLACALSAPAFAADFIDSVAGVYTRPRPSDLIEIVRVDNDKAYMRIETQFTNAHTCSFQGILAQQGQSLHYSDPERLDNSDQDHKYSVCAFDVAIQSRNLTVTIKQPYDPAVMSMCHIYCGAHGTLNTKIGMDRKRAIRHLPKILDSEDYKRALGIFRGELKSGN